MVTLWFVSAALLDEMIFMEPRGQGRGRLKRGEGRVRHMGGELHTCKVALKEETRQNDREAIKTWRGGKAEQLEVSSKLCDATIFKTRHVTDGKMSAY